MVNKNAWKSSHANILIFFTECECQNSLDGNVCNATTGQCGLCKAGFFGDFCTRRGRYSPNGVSSSNFKNINI